MDFFEKYQIDGVIAVAVSGGADSLALALRLHESGKKIVAVTVDHKLRKESADEAQFVSEVMRTKGIEHHILVWDGEKPKNGVEEAARRARYRLLIDFCKSRNIGFLATGHHLRDQAETFLLRLQRGSGVFGLSAILPISERGGIKIIRPQLDKTPDELKDYLRLKNVSWIEDPMNQDDDFARVRMRKFLPKLKEIGIDERRLAETAAVLAKSRAFLQGLIDEFVQNNVRWWDETVVCFAWEKLKKLHEDVAVPMLGQLLQKVGKTDYAPEVDEIVRVLEKNADFKGCTLGNCELFLAAKRLWIVPQDDKNEVMSRAEWKIFEDEHSEYKNGGLPYKVRRALWQKNRKI